MRYKILLVDDREDGRDVYKRILEAEGYSVLTAPRAEPALFEVADSKPDLVLSDVSMPGLDGFQLCQKLRRDPRTAAIPIVLMSALRRDEMEQAGGLEAGADDYLPRPFSPRFLIA